MTKRAFLLLIAALALAGCAGAKKVAVSPAAGKWDYKIATPDGNYTGTLTITGTPDEMAGAFFSNDDGATLQLENLVFEDPELTCDFVHPQFGRLSVSTAIDGDAMEGSIAVPGYGDMPMTAERKVEAQ